MSPAAGAGSSPGPRWESPGTPGCSVPFSCGSYGSALAVAGRMEHGVNSDRVSADPRRVMGPKAACLAEVFRAAQPKKVDGATGGGVLFAVKSWPAAQRRLAANGGEAQVARGVPAVLTVRARAVRGE